MAGSHESVALPPAVRRALQIYASCTTYQDEVVVTHTPCDKRGKPDASTPTNVIRCTTRFDRARFREGAGFRFDFRTHWQAATSANEPPIVPAEHLSVIWQDGKDFCSCLAGLPIVQRREFDLASAAAYGVSAGVSKLVAPALFGDPSQTGDTWYHGAMRFEHMRDVGVEVCEGRPCIRVEGITPITGEHMAMWFDVETGLLIACEEISTGDDARERIVIAPTLNQPIDPALLTYAPPAVSAGRAMLARAYMGVLTTVVLPFAYVGAWFLRRKSRQQPTI
jgi:hypothetical protein